MNINNIKYKIDWRPLEELAQDHSLNLGDFMYMCTIGTINLYKHRITRHYINIDNNNNCYKYNNGQYVTIKTTQAVYNVLS